MERKARWAYAEFVCKESCHGPQIYQPATEEVIATFDEFTSEQIDQVLAEADTAFCEWRQTSFAERARLARRAAEVLRDRKDRYAGVNTAEMGKPITESESVINDPRVRDSLTGSYMTGEQVGSAAGRTLKKAVLGCSDAYIVLADADLNAAANHIGAK
jgi:acyl-CoA reductase-like NAD-dependent aldehyde dehydrogenase